MVFDMNTTIIDIFGEEILVKEKICSYCSKQKNLSEFTRHFKGENSGYRNQCRTCVSDHKKQIDKLKKDNFMPENHKCPICNRNEEQLKLKNKIFVCDHNHATGKFRGYLCTDCNVGLGIFEDDVDRIIRAIDYLKKDNDYEHE
jgi:hypothetical protein